MASVNNIGWGGYSNFEGPFYWGKYRLPKPESNELYAEAVYVMAQTEGCADSINMYDVCIMTSGAIQWCDRAPQLSVADMLGYVSENHSDPGYVQRTLGPALKASSAMFRKNAAGKWRFFIDGIEVNTPTMQKKLYFAGSSGRKGQWSAAQKAHAKLWAASVASVFENAEARELQSKFTQPKMGRFILAEAQKILFDDSDPLLKTADPSWVRATRVAYISYAGNNPTRARNALVSVSSIDTYPKWSKAWCVMLLSALTSQHKIYPERYRKIRPVLESMYGIDLPNTPTELKTFNVYSVSTDGFFTSLKDVQRALLQLGFDPNGVDGIFGNDTRKAMQAFQKANGHQLTRMLTPAAIKQIAEAEIARLKRQDSSSVDEEQPESSPAEVDTEGPEDDLSIDVVDTTDQDKEGSEPDPDVDAIAVVDESTDDSEPAQETNIIVIDESSGPWWSKLIDGIVSLIKIVLGVFTRNKN